MRAIRTLISAALAAGILVGLSGCENTTEAVPKLDSAPAVGVGGAPAPKTQKEYMEQNKKPGENPYGSDYPGSR
jgi:hypothetical protein